MLVSIAINPATLGTMSVVCADSRNGALRLLDAVMRNAVLVAYSGEDFSAKIAESVAPIREQFGQRFAILTEELLKDQRQRIAHPLDSDTKLSGPERLIALARDYRVDLVVCANNEELAAVRSELSECECCLLSYFEDSVTEERRRAWDQAVELTPLSTDECLDVIGRIVKYAPTVVLADKMIGRAASGGDQKKVERFMRGAVFVAKAWLRTSPLASRGHVGLEIVTDSYHHRDLTAIHDIIERSVEKADRDGCIGNLQITLKLESNPAVFSDRFLGVGRRAWTVQHGLDDLGGLFIKDPARRRPTILGPDCTAYRHMLSKIMKLADADA